MDTQTDEPFSKKMRVATRDIHKISDSLVNAKLAFAMSDDSVWAEGLLIFYEIFKYLEDHCPADILPEEFHRTAAFEEDLTYYLGTNWKSAYSVRTEVHEYLNHLEDIFNQNPMGLMAYVYHLYMGLLSGGQILQKKRSFFKKINPLSSNDSQQGGFALTSFNGHKIFELKKKMRNIVDEKALTLDQKTRDLLMAESRQVFELNNKIIRTVKGVNNVGLKKLAYFVAIISIFVMIYKASTSLN